MNLENNVLSDTKGGDCMILFIGMSSIGQYIEAESRLVVAIAG